MPFEHHWEMAGVLIVYRGDLVLEEVLASHSRVACDPRFDDLRFVVVDLRFVERVLLAANDLVEINAFLTGPRLTNPGICIAVITENPAALSAVVLDANLPDRNHDVRIFPSMEAARRMVAQWRSTDGLTGGLL